MKNIILAATLIAATPATAQTILNGDFSNYTAGATSTANYTNEINTGTLVALGNINSWNHYGDVKIHTVGESVGVGGEGGGKPTETETRKDSALWINGAAKTGANRAEQEISIPTTGIYTFSFQTYTLNKARSSAYLDAYLLGGTNLASDIHVENLAEVSDSALTNRSFQVELKAGKYLLGFRNNFDKRVAQEFYVDNVSVTNVPEPTSTALLGLGSLGLLLRRRR